MTARTAARPTALELLVPLLAALLLLTLLATPATAGEYNVAGRGNGHGIGLSQYGAQAQALDGRTAERILNTYYKGSTTATRTAGFDPRIGVAGDEDRLRTVVRDGTAAVTVAGTSATAAEGSVWTITPAGSGSCTTALSGGTTWTGACPTFDPAGAARIELRTPAPAGKWHIGHSYGRDSVLEVLRDGAGLDAVVELPMEQYLYGLAEMPYSWEPEALQAQAIAGRSYALHRLLSVGPNPDRGCSCHLYDSQQDQVFKGADREVAAATRAYWPKWRAAVDATTNVVVHYPGGIGTRDGVVQAFYSSSSNGRTEAKHELWGGATYPYLVSVDDPWSRRDFNPHRAWQAAIPEESLEARTGFDDVGAVEVLERSSSGAATKVRISGRDNGKDTSVVKTGSWLRTALGLRSTTIDDVFMPPFRDDDGSRFEGDIVWLAGRSITSGCNSEGTTFCPDATVTRGQMAKFLQRALSLPGGSKVFKDTRGHRFEREIAAIARAGITSGCNSASTRFCPDDEVTRGQMAAFLVRALNLPDGNARFDDTRGHRFEDEVAALAKAGITTGCTSDRSRFCPDDAVTREQMAAFLHRALG